MTMCRFLWALLACFSFQAVWAADAVAPAVPDLTLPAEPAAEQTVAPAAQPVSAADRKPAVAKKASARKSARATKTPAVPPVTKAAAKVNAEEIVVENLMNQPQPAAMPAVQTAGQPSASLPDSFPAQPEPAAVFGPAGQQSPASDQAVPVPAAGAPSEQTAPVSVPSRTARPAVGAELPAAAKAAQKQLVAYNPPTDRDPTLSPDDTLLLKHREEERLRALEAERRRKLEAERRRLAELERQRQLELERLRDPSREIRGKIRVSGIIGQEAFIGSKIYSVGQSVLGARIVSVQPDAVVFTYKGQRFTKRVELK